MDKLLAMKVFCRVYEAESFKLASDSLNISRPMVTRYINSIEEELGTKLLQRNTRNISVTHAGRKYYQHCVAILEAVDEAESEIGELTQKPKGLLKVSVPMDFGLSHLVPLLEKFSRLYPQIELDIDFSDKRVDMMESGVDIAIRGGDLGGDQFVARRLCKLIGFVCASPDYVLAHGMPTHLDELKDHSCLLYGNAQAPDRWSLTDEEGALRTVRVSGVLRTNNGSALTRFALAGLGIIYQPDFLVAKHIESGKLVNILPHYKGYEFSFYAIYPQRKLMSIKTRLLLAFLQDELGSMT
ncbi:LysR family transcriptional regulator [Marinomonas sp. M1K-6]|uniref:LysR family transcriptional regulator n=1 Tax=Marinomonas profundi TaxID=2726122 RepID=A0A847R6E6_9GAMM|nr:LysR family transcriptional regulator [Marinomonas profundi]NLQ16484.1 LysR family transcriptional regulator [Marinomonas profundi]UDV03926.1 LysR family transcriptional regulator [Marinomonas profundi]